MNYIEKELNKTWYVLNDTDNIGKENEWFCSIREGAKEAYFPGFIQDTIKDYKFGTGWFWNEFELDEVDAETDSFLKLGFSEYVAEYWLNGEYVGRFEGRMQLYELECTGKLKVGKNLLAIRIVFAGDKELEGFVHDDMPITYTEPGRSSTGGVLYPVRLVYRPKNRIENVIVIADPYTGKVTLDYTVHQTAQEQMTVDAVILSKSGEVVFADRDCKEAIVKDCTLWDFDNPYLYTLILTLTCNGKTQHAYSLRFGFRHFCVKDGWFHLNGKRVFMHGTFNTDGWHPVGAIVNINDLRNEIIQIKAQGFNIFRYHNNNILPEVLECCDEVGVGVVESHAGSWDMKETNRFYEEMYDSFMVSTIEKGINHTSLVAYELINESKHERERIHAVNVLSLIRKYDKTRMVFLGSGRWDMDLGKGSVSNPFSDKWDCVWGYEDPDAGKVADTVHTCWSYPDLGEWTMKEDDLCCWDYRLGDVHMYPRVPMTYRGKYIYRYHSAAEEAKPFICTEFGTNAMGDVQSFVRHMEQRGINSFSELAQVGRSDEKFLLETWDKYHLEEVYPHPENLRMDSLKLCAEVRTYQTELLRANPKMAGYMAYSSSSPYFACGYMNCHREPAPYIAEAFYQMNYPLHWCLFIEPGHVYAGQPFTIEAVLSNEDVIGPGTYPVSAKLVSKENGCVWKYSTSFTINETSEGEYQPTVIEVFKETIEGVPAGTYDCTVYLERGGAPTGGMKSLTVSEAEEELNVDARFIGVTDNCAKWLCEKKVNNSEKSNLIIVGAEKLSDEEWNGIVEKVENGARAIILQPEVLLKDVEDPYEWWTEFAPERLPVAEKGRLHFTDNWAYRMQTVMMNTEYSKGLPLGLLGDQYYDQTEPIFVFENATLPSEVISVSLAVPYFDKSADEIHGTLGGFTAGIYNIGKGKLLVTSYRLQDELGKNPAAGKILKAYIDGINKD